MLCYKKALLFPCSRHGPVFIPSRLQDAGGFQHHRPDIRWHERCVHGAGLLQQLHCLQAAQGFLLEPAHQVRAGAKCVCVKQWECESHYVHIPSLLALSPVHYNLAQPQSLFIMMFNSLCSHRGFPSALWQ